MIITKSVVLQDDYRYYLARKWNDSLPMMAFILLNPATRYGEQKLDMDDSTIQLCYDLAEKWGKGGFVVLNLYAAVAGTIDQLKTISNPIGADNDDWIRKLGQMTEVDLVVAAWGDEASANRVNAVKKILQKELGIQLYCVRKNPSGNPMHLQRMHYAGISLADVGEPIPW
ncbi:DUF1643 domain-containing protein [Bifidobacterium sp. ESL0728]|uniref:DUF1643 domain-containing protein n=1 Tax=Bifidobacterium sp. ESL0728 TaxID=2983220 RepID=UPI0023F6D94B|nr:DUF1643 domain-containing protein [Bifidobacterium sp. ESL0728]WEV59041.1 DUF1643 domain-containing protein [Bifidobacterium sp. ESL0728]